ncbi:transposase [Streptomyces sp. NPDC006527]|uniref:transposase n=1 Tax=Streptomyces sp. NPDC006527 TaxID=3364749 RepID=UPI00367D0564
MEDGDAVRAGGGLPAASRTALRGPAVRRLLALRAAKTLTAGHVRVAADALGVSERTVWRWLAAAQSDETAAAYPGARSRVDARFTITPEVRGLLALWKGNVRAVHRELVLRAARQSTPADAPSLTTLHRAIRRDLTPGERAGLAGGERAARKHDVFLARPRSWRNHVWETDHVQAAVLVEVDGKARRPWITWFTDCATNAITGVAVTPGHPSRESVLAALRSAVLREDPYGPFGGLPEKLRVDRGKDFLSRTVTAAFDLLDVTVEDLPAYTPHLKGTVEGLNRAVERCRHWTASSPMTAPLPAPTHAHQRRSSGSTARRPRPSPHALLTASPTDFTGRLHTLAWLGPLPLLCSPERPFSSSPPHAPVTTTMPQLRSPCTTGPATPTAAPPTPYRPGRASSCGPRPASPASYPARVRNCSPRQQTVRTCCALPRRPGCARHSRLPTADKARPTVWSGTGVSGRRPKGTT